MRTKLVKLLYFVDFRAWESFGPTIPGVEWMWHNYGPFSASIVAPCERMEVNGELRTRTSENYFGAPEYHIDATTTGTTRYYTVDQLILERVTRHNLNRHFFKGHTLERALRDIHAIGYGLDVLRPLHHDTGRVALGLDPQTPGY